METKIQLHEKGLKQYPKPGIILANLVMILWITLGGIACWFFYPPAKWLYLALAIPMIYVVLRKLVCTNCYYYGKWCSMGWGKLSALFFGKGKIEDFKTSAGMKIAPVTYGILTIIPLILISISLVREYIVCKMAALILLILVSVYSGAISRKKACARCKMRTICPGSAVK